MAPQEPFLCPPVRLHASSEFVKGWQSKLIQRPMVNLVRMTPEYEACETKNRRISTVLEEFASWLLETVKLLK